MKVFAQFLLSFWPVQFLYAQVTIEEVTINAEFYGPFNRSQVEIVFYNSTKRDNIEGSCLIQTNRSAVVYDLSVEMDNTLRHAETFSRATGESIYHNVVTQRKDPALLTKTGPGAFYLSVFPVRKKERLRAVIRFISVLEDNEQGCSSFSFYSLPNSPKNLTVRALVPPGTAIAFSGRELAVPDGSSEPNDGFELPILKNSQFLKRSCIILTPGGGLLKRDNGITWTIILNCPGRSRQQWIPCGLSI